MYVNLQNAQRCRCHTFIWLPYRCYGLLYWILKSKRIKLCKAVSTFSLPNPLQWHHNGRDSVYNHQPRDCLLNLNSDADQIKHQSSASLDFVRGIHWDRWIPRTDGQLRWKCFHLMTSSCVISKIHIVLGISICFQDHYSRGTWTSLQGISNKTKINCLLITLFWLPTVFHNEQSWRYNDLVSEFLFRAQIYRLRWPSVNKLRYCKHLQIIQWI